jgi:hypothetical protein
MNYSRYHFISEGAILDGQVRTGFIWLRTGTNGRLCEDGNDPSAFVKGGDFINK